MYRNVPKNLFQNVGKCTEKTISKVIWVGKGTLDVILSQINKKIGDRFHFQWHRRCLTYQVSNYVKTRSTGHASSHLSSGRIKDRTRETAEIEPTGKGYKVKTCKGWKATHLHWCETFENLLHTAPVKRTFSGMLHFKIGTVIYI